ncbi:MAG: sensor histidine kinase [Marinoscillum sp.]
MKIIATAFALCLMLSISAQNQQIDSLKFLLNKQTGRDRVGSLNELSWYYKNINPDTAKIYAREAIAISEKLKDEQLTALSINSLGTAYQTTGNYDSAIVFLRSALAFHQSLQDSVRIASTLNNLGICYDEQGNYEHALQHYFEGLKIIEQTNDLNTEAMLISNIGIVYKKMKDYDQVLRYYERSLGLYKQLNHHFGIAATIGNIGSVHIQLKNFQQAISSSRQAQGLYKELGYSRYIPYMIGNEAIASDSLRLENAEELYRTSIEGHEAHSNHYELAYQYKNLASHYLRKGNLLEAQNYSTLARVSAAKIGAKEMLKDALKLSAQVSANRQDYGSAYKYQLEYEVVKDSIFQETKTKQIYELQTQYETEKKEQQIALQSAEISEQKAQNQRNLAVIIGLIFTVVLLISVILLVRSRARKKQALLQQEAEIKFREMQIEAAISSQEKERSRFAKDLHDGFGQMISILNLNLKSLEAGDQDKHEVFENSSKVLDEMYQELKGICFNLMPQTLIKHGITAALKEFASRINLTNQLLVETDFFGLEERLTDVQEISLYRIAQEWVNNVMKYSDADKVMIQITRDEDEITLLIEDNGIGFDEDLLKSGKGNGWKNMNSRANLINGKLELDTSPGMKGSTLILETVPEKIPHPVLT